MCNEHQQSGGTTAHIHDGRHHDADADAGVHAPKSGLEDSREYKLVAAPGAGEGRAEPAWKR